MKKASIFGNKLVETAERVRSEQYLRDEREFERGRSDRRRGLKMRSLDPHYRRGYISTLPPRAVLSAATLRA